MVSVMLALFLAALDQTIMGVALPRVIGDLGGLDLFAWPITSYMLASTAVVPVVGKLSDVYGRKPFIVAGIVIFVAGSALAGASGSMWELIGFRTVQGLGAGLIMANAFTSLGDYFAPAERGRWMGLLAGTFALASVLGPLLGGVITDEISWRWVFYINVPVGVLAIAMVVGVMPWYRTARDVVVDYRGGLLLIATAVPLLLAFSWAGNQYGWADARVVGTFAAAAGFAVAFVASQRGLGEDAIIPLSLFRSRAFLVSTIVMSVVGVAMFGTIQFMPLFLQGAQGVSATSSGTISMPMSLGVVVGSIVTGQLITRTGRYRPLAIAGGAAMIGGPLLLATLDVDSSRMLTRSFMALMGLAVGIAMPLYTLVVQNAVPHRLLGVGTATNQFFRQTGGTIGIAIFGSIMVSGFATQLSAAFPDSFAQLKSTPQILLDRDRLAAFEASIEAQAPGTAAEVIGTARAALAGTITDLFLIAAVVMAVGLVAALFLPKLRFQTQQELITEMRASGDGPAATRSPLGTEPDLVARMLPQKAR